MNRLFTNPCGCGSTLPAPCNTCEQCRTMAQVKLDDLVYVQGLNEDLCERFQLLSDALDLRDCAGNPVTRGTPLVTCETAQANLCNMLAAMATGGPLQLGVTQVVGKDCQGYTVPETPLTVADSSTLDLSAAGSFGHSLTGSVKVSATAGNAIDVLADGLYVAPGSVPETACEQIQGFDTGSEAVFGTTLLLGPDCEFHRLPAVPAAVTVQDTETVDLTLAGQQISADVNVSGDSQNLLTVRPDGLAVMCPDVLGCAVPVTVQDTPTVNMTVVGQLVSSDVRLSADAGNDLSAHADGLYTSVCAKLAAAPTGGQAVPGVTELVGVDCLGHTIPAETPLSVTDSSTIDFTATGPAGHNLTGSVRVCPGALITVEPCGLQLTADVVQDQAWSISNNFFTYDSSVNTASFQPSTDAGNALTQGTDGFPYVPPAAITPVDTNCIDMQLAGPSLSAVLRVNPAADNLLQCTASGAYVPSPTFLNTGGNCVTINFVEGPAGVFAVTVSPVIDPDPSNGLECRPNGLWAPGGGLSLCDGTPVVAGIPLLSTGTLGSGGTNDDPSGIITRPIGEGSACPQRLVGPVCADAQESPLSGVVLGVGTLGAPEWQRTNVRRTALSAGGSITQASLLSSGRNYLMVDTGAAAPGDPGNEVVLEPPADDCGVWEVWIKNVNDVELPVSSSSGDIDGVASITLQGTVPAGYPYGNNGGESVHLVWEDVSSRWYVI